MKKNNWKEFKVYNDSEIKAKALVVDNKITKVILISIVPDHLYYSVLNDAGFIASKTFIIR